ncbi:MAG: suppressor of fused domain protein [Bacteroidetes bacterium]|nr:suppressor of fused domain protein [Bacteroidota bacterium]
MKSSPSTTPLLDHVFEEHLEHYGEPDMHYPFVDESGKMPRLDVFVWHPKGDAPMTTFTTVGMSKLTTDDRAELHWTVRGLLWQDTEANAAAFLASLACFPIMRKMPLKTWHIVKNLAIPVFTKCSSVLMHPALTEGAWDLIRFGSQSIHLHNIIPLTSDETEQALSKGVADALNDMYMKKIDIFSDRP